MTQPVDHRRAAAEHSIESILDAVESLLQQGEPVTTTAVASKAGVSRVTVYAHFPTPEALLEAVAARVVQRFGAGLDELELDVGPAPDALDRLIASAWRRHARYGRIAETLIPRLGAVRLRRSHAALHKPISDLIDRGRTEGTFRTDLPSGWLLASYFALVHACGEEVRAGRIKASQATAILQASIGSLFAAPAGTDTTHPRERS